MGKPSNSKCTIQSPSVLGAEPGLWTSDPHGFLSLPALRVMRLQASFGKMETSFSHLFSKGEKLDGDLGGRTKREQLLATRQN